MTRKFDEARLFELTYSYEQPSQHRQAPAGFGPVDDRSSEMIEEWNEDQRQNMTVAETG